MVFSERMGEVRSDGLAAKGGVHHAGELPEAFHRVGIPAKADDKKSTSVDPYLQLIAENPHTGTNEQIVTLAMALWMARDRLHKGSYELLRKECNFGPKVFSKLQVIGERMVEVNTNERREKVTRCLPPSYSVMHILCSTLTAQELYYECAVRKVISNRTTVSAAKEMTQRRRFPKHPKVGKEKGRWGTAEELMFRICRPEEHFISQEQQGNLETELRRICVNYGIQLRKGSGGVKSIREEDRLVKAAFWKSVLAKELPVSWFIKQDEKWKEHHGLRTAEELWVTTVRNFSMFLRHLDPQYPPYKQVGRQPGEKGKSAKERTDEDFSFDDVRKAFTDRSERFWHNYGRAYIAKLHYEYESTTSRAQRYSVKKMIEKYLGDTDHPGRGKELAIWTNIHLQKLGWGEDP